MTENPQTLTPAECTEQVKRMARRTALLYHFFAQTLVDELGEETGKRLIAKAIAAYGEHCGERIKLAVQALELPLSEENFDRIPDLPSYGWETGLVRDAQGNEHAIASYCPLAAVWMELGPEAQKLARLYCFVDQAKQRAYNPDFEFIHAHNLLDGDPFCEFVIKPVK